jgi:hypothetical protein
MLNRRCNDLAPALPRIVPFKAMLLLSVAPLVKNNSFGAQSSNWAICSRADSVAFCAKRPIAWGLDGLAKSADKNGNMAETTSGAHRVVELLSR